MYVALLRGINVGGKNIVSMKSLKASFERLGFQGVTTYINSGNVLFRAAQTNPRKLERQIDRMLPAEHGVPGKTVVRSYSEMARLVKKIAATWEPNPEWRYNVVFLRHPIDSKDVLAAIEVKPDVERVVYYPGTLLWSVRLNELSRSALLKLASRPIYKEMTVRNLNTSTKVFELMKRMQQTKSSDTKK